MTRAQRFYRLLMQAYPAAYRDQYEDEMVAVLLDTADNRRRLRVREAAAIVAAGLAARLGARAELWHGLRLGSLGAVAIVAAIGTVGIGVATTLVPHAEGVLPAAGWALVAGLALLSARSTSTYRLAPPGVAALAQVAAGAQLMGFTRSVLTVVATCLLLIGAAPRLPWRHLSVATAVGVGAGLLAVPPPVLILTSNGLNPSMHWVAIERWDRFGSWLGVLGRWSLVAVLILAVVGLIASRGRTRFIWAGLVLAAALSPTVVAGRNPPWRLPLPHDALYVVAVGAAAVVVGLAVVVPWRAAR